MNDRPEQFRFALGLGTVLRLYPEAFEVDIASEDGGEISRALVIGPRFPEISNAKETKRPQWVLYGYVSALHGRAVCWPIEARLMGDRTPRADVVYYDEFLNFRITSDRAGTFEVINTNGENVTRIRIEQNGPFIRLETPHLKLTIDDAGELVEIDAANIHLGKDAVEKLVLGSTFLQWLQAFIQVFNTHVHPNVGPNSNPAPGLPTILSEVSKTL